MSVKERKGGGFKGKDKNRDREREGGKRERYVKTVFFSETEALTPLQNKFSDKSISEVIGSDTTL